MSEKYVLSLAPVFNALRPPAPAPLPLPTPDEASDMSTEICGLLLRIAVLLWKRFFTFYRRFLLIF